MARPSHYWKDLERRVASFFGTRRTPLSGGNSGHTRSDTLHDDLFIETKVRKRSAVYGLWQATRKLARKERKIPVLAIGQKNHEGFLIVVHSSDWAKVMKQQAAGDEPPHVEVEVG